MKIKTEAETVNEQKVNTVRIRLPLAEDTGNGLAADQNEQVIVNGRVWNLHRGEWIELPAELFPILRERYQDL